MEPPRAKEHRLDNRRTVSGCGQSFPLLHTRLRQKTLRHLHQLTTCSAGCTHTALREANSYPLAQEGHHVLPALLVRVGAVDALFDRPHLSQLAIEWQIDWPESTSANRVRAKAKAAFLADLRNYRDTFRPLR